MSAALPQRRRILIVDDQPANIELLASALEDVHELYFATTGVRALEIVGAVPVDLVLLDVLMPDMDGYELCRRLKAREDTRDIPVVFVTGLGEVHDEMAGFEIGGVDYITKPVSAPIVRARVRTHLELKDQRDLLAALAVTDALTGIPNRRHFDRSLDEEWNRALREEDVLAVVLLDVDDFKQFNDAHGHARGDECLQALAQLLHRSFRRAGEVVARYGGEEFAAVLPRLDAERVSSRLEELLEAVERLAIPHGKSRAAPHVTLSLGAVTLRASRAVSQLEVLRMADEQLYAAKEAGRNRAVHLDHASSTRSVLRVPAR